MSKDSPMRKLRRMRLKQEGATFADRMREAVRTGTAVKSITWTEPKRAVKEIARV